MAEETVVVTWERNGRPLSELLSTRLTLDELREFGGELAGVCEEIGTQTSHEDSVKKELKAIMARLEARRDELASIVRRREQLRSVECIWERNYGDGQARKIRLDSGEVIAHRALREDERQPPLVPEVADAVKGAEVVHSEAK